MVMKKRIFMMACILAAGIALAGCSAQRGAVKNAAEAEALRATVDSGNYRIAVSTAYPASGQSLPLTSPYSLEIRDGSLAVSYLPYFGRAYSLPYGGGEGLTFTGKAENYAVVYGKGGDARITFDVRTPEDTYGFSIELFPGGSAYINVSPNNKRYIGFSGALAE